jgi:hypothetical protein
MKLQGVEKNSGLGGKYANESLALLNKMLATPWFHTVNKCLLDTVDMEDLEDDELFGINAVEELLTDFLQLTHAVIRDVLPKDPEPADYDEDNENNYTQTANTATGAAPDIDGKMANMALKKGPGLGQFMAVLSTMQTAAEKVKEVEDSSSISSQEDSDEPFELKLDDYPVSLQLSYHLLLRNTEVVDPDMRFYLLDSVHCNLD